MARVFRENGFTGQVWPNDHQPPHVHVRNANGEVRVDLTTFEVMSVQGMSRREERQAVDLVKLYLEACWTKWRQFHG